MEGEKKRKIPGHIRSSFWSRLSPKQGRGSDGKLTFCVIQHRKTPSCVFKTYGKILALALGGLEEKHKVQSGISVPSENLLRIQIQKYSFLMLRQVVHTPTTMPQWDKDELKYRSTVYDFCLESHRAYSTEGVEKFAATVLLQSPDLTS